MIADLAAWLADRRKLAAQLGELKGDLERVRMAGVLPRLQGVR